jgi:alpha-ketoglutarate-dependent taurine dioxygenase
MTDAPPAPSGLGGIRGARQRTAPASDSLVRTTFFDEHQRLPMIVEPTRAGVDLAAWARANNEQIEAWIHQYGSLYFRGFGIVDAELFEATANALAGEDLYGDYGDLPREAAGEKIFGSTPYPADQTIFFHCESSHMAHWPMRIFFNCAINAETGGETPVLDTREAYRQLDPAVRDKFETLGLRYTRNFAAGIDVPWQQFFGTDSQAEVEAKCREADTDYEWLKGGEQLRISQFADGVKTHPDTGEKVFFNQVLLHHPAALPPATRDALRELLAEEDMPRNCYYGDGSVIPDEDIAHIFEVYDKIISAHRWDTGDIIMLDNMLCSHARLPFTGPRKTLVAMARIV